MFSTRLGAVYTGCGGGRAQKMKNTQSLLSGSCGLVLERARKLTFNEVRSFNWRQSPRGHMRSLPLALDTGEGEGRLCSQEGTLKGPWKKGCILADDPKRCYHSREVDSAWNPMLLEPWAWMAKQVEIRQVGPEETQIAI